MLFDDAAVSSTLVAWFVAITVGTSLVLRLVGEFSATTAIVVTTARKALTLLASFVLFPKHLGIGHPIGAALVFGSAFVAQRKKRSSGSHLPTAADPAPSLSWPERGELREQSL